MLKSIARKGVAFVSAVAKRAAPWLRQTSTITGISTLVGLLVALLTGEMTWQVALPVAAGAVVAMVLPGHPEVQGLVAKVAVDAAAMASPGTRTAGLKELGRDLPAAVNVVVAARTSAD